MHLGLHQPMRPPPPTRIQMHRLICGTSQSSVCKWRCGGPKVKGINVSQMLDRKTTYLQHVHIVQPLGTPSKHSYGVHRPCHRHDRIKITSVNVKIECLNDKTTREYEKTYWILTNVMQPPDNTSKHCFGDIRCQWHRVESRLHLQRSAKCKTVKQPTWDVIGMCSHAETICNIPIGSTYPSDNAAESNLYLQTLVKCKWSELLT